MTKSPAATPLPSPVLPSTVSLAAAFSALAPPAPTSTKPLTAPTGTEAEHPTLAKIVATIGPASESPEVVKRLIENGVAVFRFNFSHGDFAAHERRLRTVREVASQLNRPIACLGDLQGPKIRVGKVPEGGIMLNAGQDVLLRRGIPLAFVDSTDPSNPTPVFPLTYEKLVDEVEPGHKVLINDGAIRMLAVERSADGKDLRCRVTLGGLVTSNKGINLPQSKLSAPAITDKDWECVAWAVQHGLDFLALSFVRGPEEVAQLKQRLEEICPIDHTMDPKGEGARIPVVAKIEMPQAVKRINEIVAIADAIMVARGDLGVEMDIARVPVAQKQILAACHEWGRPCIVATQMLETMIENASPTRAEASDVANAIFDEADAVMLSAETASGKHPALVVETMRRIISVAESRMAELSRVPSPPPRLVQIHYPTAALAHGAWHVAQDIGAKIVACWSENGGTARYLSQNNFRVPILAWSSSARSARRMALLGSVVAVHAAPPASGTLAEWNEMVDEYVLARGMARPGDAIVLLAGKPLGKAKATNTIAIHVIGESSTGYRLHR
ncbi:MAG: pyruvate kinase [Planctomycetota bacterium]|nr:pyruvate kinase [Planctomycetota bacterium]